MNVIILPETAFAAFTDNTVQCWRVDVCGWMPSLSLQSIHTTTTLPLCCWLFSQKAQCSYVHVCFFWKKPKWSERFTNNVIKPFNLSWLYRPTSKHWYSVLTSVTLFQLLSMFTCKIICRCYHEHDNIFRWRRVRYVSICWVLGAFFGHVNSAFRKLSFYSCLATVYRHKSIKR